MTVDGGIAGAWDRRAGMGRAGPPWLRGAALRALVRARARFDTRAFALAIRDQKVWNREATYPSADE